MEIIFSDQYYDSENWSKGKFAADLVTSLLEFDPNIQAIDGDIGHGADWPVVIVEIFKNIDWSSLALVGAGGFLLGNQINKNIDAWIEIAEKFRRLIKKIHPTRIDEYGAVAIALNELTKLHDKPTSLSVQILEFAANPGGKSKLSKRPDAIYLITARMPAKLIIYGISSNTNIEFKHEFDTGWYEFGLS